MIVGTTHDILHSVVSWVTYIRKRMKYCDRSMEFVVEVLSWVGDLSSGSHGCDELALELNHNTNTIKNQNNLSRTSWTVPRTRARTITRTKTRTKQEQEENDEQPAGENQKEEGRSSGNDKKHMKNAAALGLGKAKVDAEKAKEKIKGKINWIKDKCHRKDKISKWPNSLAWWSEINY